MDQLHCKKQTLMKFYIKIISPKNNTDAERLRCDVRMCMFALLQWYLPDDECACMSCYAFVCNVGKES